MILVRFVIFVIFVVNNLIVAQAQKTNMEEETLEKIYKSSSESLKTANHYSPPSSAEFKQFQSAFQELLKAVFNGDAEKARSLDLKFATIGFKIVETVSKGDRFFSVIEVEERARGGGLYILREKPSGRVPTVIMAPHRYFDMGTGEIALKLFRSTSAFVLMANTFHRYTGARAERKDIFGTDFAHREDNFFFAAFEAVLYQFPNPSFVQLHGFAKNNRKGAALKSDLILSQGRPIKKTDSLIRELANSLCAALPNSAIGVYGESAEDLGGTKNVHASAITAGRYSASFFHIEMSMELREALLKNNEAAAAFAAAVQKQLIGFK